MSPATILHLRTGLGEIVRICDHGPMPGRDLRRSIGDQTEVLLNLLPNLQETPDSAKGPLFKVTDIPPPKRPGTTDDHPYFIEDQGEIKAVCGPSLHHYICRDDLSAIELKDTLNAAYAAGRRSMKGTPVENTLCPHCQRPMCEHTFSLNETHCPAFPPESKL